MLPQADKAQHSREFQQLYEEKEAYMRRTAAAEVSAHSPVPALCQCCFAAATVPVQRLCASQGKYAGLAADRPL
jgi:hypothetical protein